MQRVAAKFVLCLLTEEQKTNHHKVGQEIFDRANNDENFLIISRVYGCDVETETQSSSGSQKRHTAQKARHIQSNMKMLFTLFWLRRFYSP